MFRASSAHLQEKVVVYMQHMAPSLSISDTLLAAYRQATRNSYIESDGAICCMYMTIFS